MNEIFLKEMEKKAEYLDSLGQTATAKDLLVLIDEINNLNKRIKTLNETLSYYLLNSVNN